jgi:hypothetical protein
VSTLDAWVSLFLLGQLKTYRGFCGEKNYGVEDHPKIARPVISTLLGTPQADLQAVQSTMLLKTSRAVNTSMLLKPSWTSPDRENVDPDQCLKLPKLGPWYGTAQNNVFLSPWNKPHLAFHRLPLRRKKKKYREKKVISGTTPTPSPPPWKAAATTPVPRETTARYPCRALAKPTGGSWCNRGFGTWPHNRRFNLPFQTNHTERKKKKKDKRRKKKEITKKKENTSADELNFFLLSIKVFSTAFSPWSYIEIIIFLKKQS